MNEYREDIIDFYNTHKGVKLVGRIKRERTIVESYNPYSPSTPAESYGDDIFILDVELVDIEGNVEQLIREETCTSLDEAEEKFYELDVPEIDLEMEVFERGII